MDIDKDMDRSKEWYHVMIDKNIVSTKPVAKVEKKHKKWSCAAFFMWSLGFMVLGFVDYEFRNLCYLATVKCSRFDCFTV